MGRALLIVSVALLGIILEQATHAAQPPNVILILADDLGAKELGCYGSTQHKTPNLDRMAAEGVRFDTFYAMPLCTPTRVALMTGQYGFHNGFLGMQNKAFTPLPSSPQRNIANHFTHAKLMKSRGYATAQAGKWQLSGEHPTLIHECGFDEYRMWAYAHNVPQGSKHTANDKYEGSHPRFWHPSIVQNSKLLPTTADQYGPDLFHEFVLDFTKRHTQEPFFVYYTSVLTHNPHTHTPDPTQPGKHWPASFKSNLEYLDHLMGTLFAGLKEQGLADNTYVIFIGDNGTGNSGKGTVTERGARVPSIVWGPGVKRGLVSKAVADLTDIMPTLADISGATLPSDRPFDGKSLLPVIRGEQTKHRDWIYSHLDGGRVLRDERWLLELAMGPRGEKFFDCGTCRDGSEYKDVTHSTDPEVQAARARFANILASLPEPKPHPEVTNTPKTKGAKKPAKKKASA